MHSGLRYRSLVPEAVAVLRLLCAAVLLCVMTVPSRPADAQAWPQKRGHLFAKASSGNSSTATQFGADGTRKPYDRGIEKDAFQDRSFYFYLEYGITSRLTLVGQLPLKHILIRSSDRSRPGSQPILQQIRATGTAEIGLRYGLTSSDRVAKTGRSISGLFQVNLPTGYRRNLSPSVGTGQVDVQTGLSVGQSLYPFPGYLQSTLAYRIRTSIYGLSRAVSCPRRSTDCLPDQQPDFGDEWIFLAEAGFAPGSAVLFQGIIHGVWSNAPPMDDFDPRNPLPTRQRLLKTGLGATVYVMRGIGISVLRFTTPAGRNTVDSVDWFFGLEYSR